MKYPLPATIVVTVDPSDTTTDCQDTVGIEPDAPKDIDVPLIVTLEFASFALAILPASFALVTVPGAISAATTVQSVIAAEPILSIAILILFYTIYNVSLLKFVSNNY
jgi:hypothetical protein